MGRARSGREKMDQDGACNEHKLIPVGVVVKGVPSLDTKGHNGVEKTRRIEPERSVSAGGK